MALNPDVQADIAQLLERQWEDTRGPTPTSVSELVDFFGGTRAVADLLGVGIRQPELWLRRERGLGGVSRPIPQARLAELQAAADEQLDEAADAKMHGDLGIDFAGDVAAQGNPDYAGWRRFSGTVTSGGNLGAFWGKMRRHDFAAAADALNATMMGPSSTGAYDFPGAEIYSVDTLTLTFPT